MLDVDELVEEELVLEVEPDVELEEVDVQERVPQFIKQPF